MRGLAGLVMILQMGRTVGAVGTVGSQVGRAVGSRMGRTVSAVGVMDAVGAVGAVGRRVGRQMGRAVGGRMSSQMNRNVSAMLQFFNKMTTILVVLMTIRNIVNEIKTN